MSNFAFLAAEFPTVHEAAAEAERNLSASPTGTAFFAGKAVEVAVKWAYRNDPGLKLPYQDNIAALLHEPSFKRIAGQAIYEKARLINRVRNFAVHEERTVSVSDAARSLSELFHFCYWFARTYARKAKPPPGLTFDGSIAGRREDALRKAAVYIKAQESELAKLRAEQAALDARNGELTKLLAEKADLDEQLKAMRAEVAAVRRAAEATPDQHDYNEAQTRDFYIDLLLREAGWPLTGKDDLEYRVEGMPNNEGVGFVDYVLWGTDGKPLGLVEAKRTRKDARAGQQQAKLYADALEAKFGQRPVIFYSNGYEHWIWDDGLRPPRKIDGFYKRDELELLIQRRTTRKKLAETQADTKIAGRPYQQRAIRSIAKAFEDEGERKALLVMATGAGKTRTVIALVDLLMRAGWVKRVLFLADRVALVNQATSAFKSFLPASAPVNLVTERTSEGRVFLSTYPTMMNLIDGKGGEKRAFGPGHFDLIVIDEAHRSVYQRYRAIFDYFDSYLVGLTATPRADVDKDTYGLFDLEPGVPTDAYTLEEAISDGHLVPPVGISVPLKIVRSGLRYDDLSPEEKDRWDMLEWGEDDIPDAVEAAEVNKRLFNQDTVDHVIAHLMQNGLKVEGGDRIGKTIIFAKNEQHAQFILDRFNAAYPSLAGHYARVITYSINYAQTLIDDFSIKTKAPHIAISVDMLDTGIDVPEVVNLVFFKPVRSKTKFWQMVGRGTRLCPDLFAPGQDKEFFYIFDYCENLEFFSADTEVKESSNARSLSERLFAARLDLVRALDEKAANSGGFAAPEQEGFAGPDGQTTPTEQSTRDDALRVLREAVAGMNLDNFIVRQKRRTVEKYQDAGVWDQLDDAAREELVEQIAPLPSAQDLGVEEAKRFDLLMFGLELALLKGSKRFDQLKKDLLEIVSALESQQGIPAIARNAVLIEEVQSEPWWEGVSVPLLELVRLRLRDLVQHIEKGRKSVVYTTFTDEIGTGAEVALPHARAGDFARFRMKARDFLRKQKDNIVLHKLRQGKPLTASDISELEKVLVDAGIGDQDDIQRATDAANGFGRFVRSLVGLDRAAVADAFAEFLSAGTATADQIVFTNMVVEHLTANGSLDPSLLYEPPFSEVAPTGPEQVFGDEKIVKLVRRIEAVNQSAVA